MKKQHSILIIAGWYPDEFFPENGDFIWYQAIQLNRSFQNIDIIANNLNFRYLFKGKIHSDILEDKNQGIDILRVRGFSFPLKTSGALKFWIASMMKGFEVYRTSHGIPEIIHAHTSLGAILANEIYNVYKVPYIVSLHGTNHMKGHYFHWFRKKLASAFFKAKMVYAVSSAMKERLCNFFPNHSFKVLPNFIDTDLFQPGAKKENKFTFISSGSLISRKQFDLLIRAFSLFSREYPASQLYILGSGKEHQQLHQLIKKQNLQNIELKGQCSQKEVASYLSKAHIYLHSSKIETFGISMIEAMACGLPVLAIDSYGPRDFIKPFNGILCRENSVEGFAAHINMIYRKYAEFDRKVIRKFIVDNYSSHHFLEIFKEIYQTVK